MDGKYKNLPWTLAKELSQTQSRPSWESSNEGIHERISFEDTIWGFNLAGGAYYDTPLRVTQVKENSRADKAGIKVGDVLRFINDFDTSLLTLQQAHDLILQSGIEIKLKLSAPDVDEPYHYTYEDEILQELREMKRKKDEESKKKRKPFKGAKTPYERNRFKQKPAKGESDSRTKGSVPLSKNSEWSYAWPCNKKRDVMYRESNCFLIPSKYEEKMQLIKKQKKLEEDRVAAQINEEKIISMMKSQNAYHMMDSDEEIEPQYLELLHKNIEKTNEIVNNINSEQETKCISELSEDHYIPDINLDVNQESNKQNTVDVFKNHTEMKNSYEEEDNNSDSNELLINNDKSKLVKNDEELQNFVCVETEDEVKIKNENERLILDNSLNSLIFIEGDLSKEEFKNIESESGNKNYYDNKEIDFQNGTVLNGKDGTQLSDGVFCIPSDDDDMFYEELVILDENEMNSDSFSTEDNKESVLQAFNNRDGYQEKDETTVTN